MISFGVDPGLSGAVAFVTSEGKAWAIPTPVVGKAVDAAALWKWVWTKMGGPAVAVIEKVHSMPKQGVASTFKFGYATGAMTAVFQCHNIPIMHVTPQAWKKAVLVGTDRSKDAAVEWARNRYPDVPLILPGKRVPNHNLAEALALAHLGLV